LEEFKNEFYLDFKQVFKPVFHIGFSRFSYQETIFIDAKSHTKIY